MIGLLVWRIRTRARPYKSIFLSEFRFIKGVVNTVKNHGKSEQMLEAEEIEARRQKRKDEEEQALMSSLYQAVDNIRACGEDE